MTWSAHFIRVSLAVAAIFTALVFLNLIYHLSHAQSSTSSDVEQVEVESAMKEWSGDAFNLERTHLLAQKEA